MLSQLSDSELDALEKKLSAKEAQKPQRSSNPLMAGAEYINEFGDKYLAPIGSAAAGFGQEVYNTGASVANLPSALFPDKDIPRLPYADLQQYLQPGFKNKAAFVGGEIAGNILPALRAAKALQAIRPIGKTGLAADIAGGAGYGYSASGRSENPEHEAKQRKMGAALGAGANIIKSTRSGDIADKVIKGKEKAVEKFESLYKNLFKEVKEKGLNEVRKTPRIKVDLISENVPKKYTKALEAFDRNPTVESAHAAQSDLGKLIRYFEKSNTPLTSAQSRALDEAALAQKKLRGTIFESLSKKGDQSLAKQYKNLTQGYKKEVVPYSDKNIRALERGELSKSKLPERLRANEKFMQEIGNQYPELGLNKITSLDSELVRSILEKAGIGAGAVGLGYGAVKAIKD